MNLKQSFEMSNYLKSLLDEALDWLEDDGNVVDITEHHLKHQVNPDAEDEDVYLWKDRQYQPEDVVRFVQKVIAEQERLCYAIAKAKLDYDTLININSNRRRAYNLLSETFADTDLRTRETRGLGKKLNINGEQVSYEYKVIREYSLPYNKANIKGVLREMRKKCAETSARIDEIVTTRDTVDFNTIFEIGDTFNDAIEKVIGEE